MGRKTKRPRAEGDAPKKCDFRQRAHSNPLADAGREHPVRPELADWHASFPQYFAAQPGEASQAEHAGQRAVEWVDVGCGYGGLLTALAPAFPDKLMLGLEIRDKVSQFAHEKILSLRREHPGSYQNCDVRKLNAQKFLPHFFRKGQLEKMMFCFPDPHFKKTNHRRRVITVSLCAEYAYCIREGGRLYTVTDCTELHEWMVRHLEEASLFERLLPEEEESDPIVPFISTRTDESIKVARNKGDKMVSVWRRLPDKPPEGLNFLASQLKITAAARLLAEARVCRRWLDTLDSIPPAFECREQTYCVQREMIKLTAYDSRFRDIKFTSTAPPARALRNGTALGALQGWKRATIAPSQESPAAEPGPVVPHNCGLITAEVPAEVAQAAAQRKRDRNRAQKRASKARKKARAADKSSTVSHSVSASAAPEPILCRAPLFGSGFTTVNTNSLTTLSRSSLNAQSLCAGYSFILVQNLVRAGGSGPKGSYTAAEVWHAVGQIAPVVEILGPRMLCNSIPAWVQAADGGSSAMVLAGQTLERDAFEAADAMVHFGDCVGTPEDASTWRTRVSNELAWLVEEILADAEQVGLCAGLQLVLEAPGAVSTSCKAGEIVRAHFGGWSEIAIQWDPSDTVDAGPRRKHAYDKNFLPTGSSI